MWSLAVCYVEIWTEKPPYPELSHLEAALRVRDKGLIPSIPSDMPEFLRDICQSCFSSDPSKRPSAADVAWYLLDRLPDDQ
jgi:serine/threonine protein kinase